MRNNSYIIQIVIGGKWCRIGQMENNASRLTNNLLYFVQQGFHARIEVVGE